MTEFRTITPQDVIDMRGAMYGDDVKISRAEMEKLFAVAETAAPDSCMEWTQFFTEAGADHLVYQVEPEGYLSEENATWLLDRITKDGNVCVRSELELLIRVLEKSRSVPAGVVTFALQQVAEAVLNGTGPLAFGGSLKSGVITKDEVDLVRRIIHAMGDDSNIGIDQEEAEMLFLLNDRSIHAENDPSWNDLFVRAVANYVVGNARPAAPTVQDQMRWKAALEDNTGFFARAARGTSEGWTRTIKKTVFGKRQPSEAELRNRAYEAETKAAETVTSREAVWLADKINRDGALHKNELDLLKFIKEISPSIDDSLTPLIKRVA
jgi:hypothetical protein